MNKKVIAVITTFSNPSIIGLWSNYGAARASYMLNVFKPGSFVDFEYYKLEPTKLKLECDVNKFLITDKYYIQDFEDHFVPVEKENICENDIIAPIVVNAEGKNVTLFESFAKALNAQYHGYDSARAVVYQFTESISRTTMREFEYAVGL